MTLEIVRGNIQNKIAIDSLISKLESLGVEGTFYAGYPIIASADSSHTLEALLVSQSPGLIIFSFPRPKDSADEIRDTQDKLYFLIEGNLKKHEILRDKRDLCVKPNVISFFPPGNLVHKELDENGGKYLFAEPDTLKNALDKCEVVNEKYLIPLRAAIDRVTTIKPTKKRINVTQDDSKGGILKKIEKEIANLDQWQKKAAIEEPTGIQRIRGLAGSGKTVVIALKAAYLHAQHPDWEIVVTFNTRSLVQQFEDLIERFSMEHSGDKPNWEKLKIMHAWGSSYDQGVYSDIVENLNLVPLNYATAKNKYGADDAFEGICSEILPYLKNQHDDKNQLYDVVLIDEAQDLPPSFFQMIFQVVKSPKRIVLAYDELQNLTKRSMPPIENLFGQDSSGGSLINIDAQQDIMLPVCYRNTHWALTLAHGLGFGIYRDLGLVQLFDDLTLWEEVGYKVENGSLEFGQPVTLSRQKDSYPHYFGKFITPNDAIISKRFENKIEQYDWIASEIDRNINEEELDPDDILIIFCNAYTSKGEYPVLNRALLRLGHSSHLAGVSSDRDIFTRKDSVTTSSIYRAKGNEAPMVYIVNADHCAIGQEMIQLRNILFTAITRSRGWVRICGVGEDMDLLEKEIKKIQSEKYRLSFNIPSKDELESMRVINRDRTKAEKQEIAKVGDSLRELRKLIDQGVVNPDTFPELRELLNLMKKNDDKEV